PMSYCYAHRLTGEITPLVQELREELYTKPYDAINWKKARYHCHKSDRYYPITRLFKVFQFCINAYEKVHSKRLRKKAVKFMLEYMEAENEQTSYINIGPVNKAINSICAWHAYGKDSPKFKEHIERWYD